MNKDIFFPILLVIGIFFAIISGSFLTEGMFFDGLIYSTIAKSLSQGIGSFWNLCFSEGRPFTVHPPLAMGLQSLFYRLLGDSFYVEKIYSVFTVILSSLILFRIWKELEMNVKNFWVVLLLWLLVPSVTWASTNNILENTMNIFVLLSVWAYLRSLKNLRFLYCFLAGAMLFLAFLCKGFTGLYPLALPFFYWLFMQDRKFASAIQDTLLVLAGLAIVALLTFTISPYALQSIETYIKEQVLNSIDHIATKDSRFFILNSFLSDMIIPAIIVLVVFIIGKLKKTVTLDSRHKKLCCVFFALALSGVIPIMVSLKQSSFYIITVFPHTALALGCLMDSTLTDIQFGNKTTLVFRIVSASVFLMAIGLNIYFCGKVGRDKDMLADIHALLPALPEKTTVATSTSMRQNNQFWTYMEHYHGVYIGENDSQHLYYITTADDKAVDSCYHYVETGAENYLLYKKTE